VKNSDRSIGSAGSVLPKAPAKPNVPGISAAALSSRIDAFLASRGITAPQPGGTAPADRVERTERPDPPEPPRAAEFVCEADVREAIAQKRKIVIGEKTIVTPAARDLGDAHKVLVQIR
jgi:hypothetical protein